MTLLVRLGVLAALGVATLAAGVLMRRWFSGGPVPSRFDASDLSLESPGAALVQFTTPYCYECKEAIPLLKAASLLHATPLRVIDAKERPDLAEKYSVRRVPTVAVVDAGGKVRGWWLGMPADAELEAALVQASSAL